MKKRTIIFTTSVVAFALMFASFYTVYEKSKVIETSATLPGQITVVIDPGHGGFDGGTSGSDGAVEKDINLSISLKLKAQLTLLGIPCVMSRVDDSSTNDANFKTLKEKKTSDIKNRLKLVNDTKNSILLSIHQNFYTSEKYNGLQVFYSKNDTESEALASLIQDNTHRFLQKENDRQIKEAERNLYLLHKATVPSVLVECGFMSNGKENKLLQNEAYQTKIAYLIAMSINQYQNQMQRGIS